MCTKHCGRSPRVGVNQQILLVSCGVITFGFPTRLEEEQPSGVHRVVGLVACRA